MKKNPNSLFKKPLIFLAGAFLIFVVFIAMPSYASAAAGTATLSFSPLSGSYTVGVPFSISVQVNTLDTINSVQADINFDKNVLNVASIDTGSSIFTMWPELSSVSSDNSTGVIHFTGGLGNPGFSGTGTIFVINFNSIAQAASTKVFFAPGGQVFPNDGSGTSLAVLTLDGNYIITPPKPTVSCSAPSADPGQPITFTAAPLPVSGAPYKYVWTAGCTPDANPSTCTNSTGYPLSGPHSDVSVKVTDKNNQSATATCSVNVNFPTVSCSASPNPVDPDKSVTFIAAPLPPSGAPYKYAWTAGCTPDAGKSTCTNPSGYDSSGIKTTVSVTDQYNNQSSSATNCSVNVNGVPGLNISCLGSPNPANAGDQVTFTAAASGGTGSYTYSWTGACTTGTSSTCSNSFSGSGMQTATVTVTSGTQSTSGSCTVYINPVCPVTGAQGGAPGGTGVFGATGTTTITVIQNTQQQVQQAAQQVSVATKNVKKAVNTPVGSVITKVISTTGVVATAVAATIATSVSLPAMLLLPFRLFSLLMVAFGIRKKSGYWGIVYDSVTKQPIDPAYVTLQTLEGKDISSTITDIEGRYGFLVEPDIYKIVVRRTNYSFPSRKLFGKINDEVYGDLYFGEGMEIKKLGEGITKNIPIDPVRFDWNEFAKKDKGLVRLYSNLDLAMRKISNLFFAAGFVVAVGALYFDARPYNAIILGLYLFLTILMMLGFRPKAYGSLIDQKTGNPLSFSIVHVIESSLNKEISRKVADKYGRYYSLVPKGQYYLKIERKNEDGSYSLAYTSPVIDVSKKGIINKTFRI